MINKEELTYQWESTFTDPIKHKGINRVVTELEVIKEVYGQITPAFLLESAKNKNSVFHDYFEWDDSKAAHLHRLEEARYLLRHIEVRIIRDGEEKISRAYEVVTKRNTSNEYKDVSQLNQQNMNVVIDSMISDLRGLKKRLEFYGFDSAVGYVTATMEYLVKAKDEEQGAPIIESEKELAKAV